MRLFFLWLWTALSSTRTLANCNVNPGLPTTLNLRFAVNDSCEQSGFVHGQAGGLDDYVAWAVYIPTTGWYQCTFSTTGGPGLWQLEWFRNTREEGILTLAESSNADDDFIVHGQDDVYLTHGWHHLAVKALTSGWKLDWMELNLQRAVDCSFELSQARIPAQDYCAMHGIQSEPTADPQGGDYNVAYIDPNDWMAYDVTVRQAGWYQAQYRIASLQGSGSLQLEQESNILQTIESFPSTGDWQNWETVSSGQAFYLSKGTHSLVVKAREGGWNLNWFELHLVETVDDCLFEWNTRQTKIQAENFCEMSGVGIQETADTGGGMNVAWIDTNDWMAYRILLPDNDEDDLWEISFRIASPDGKGGLELEVLDTSTSDKDDVIASLTDKVGLVVGVVDSMPNTGGWQNWQTVSIQVLLTPGLHWVILRSTQEGWNLNWMEFQKASSRPSVPPPPPVPSPVARPVSPPVAPPIARPPPGPASGFVRARGTAIVDPNGDNLILRGMGFGGWLLQEPYMMLVANSAMGGQHDILANVENLIGTNRLETYHQAWLDNWCQESDVEELKRSGFNSLRVALHYNLFTLPIERESVRGQDTWLDDGFERLDRLLEWCINHQVYLILDLHAAPGGQGRNAQINDYDDSKPSLWEDEENIRKTIALWVEFAKRYRNEPWIAGYDLINEPNWDFSNSGHPNGCSETQNAPLKAFYDQIIPAIREVDRNHLIVVEGNCWSNNHKGLWPIDDDNVALSFHRYWIPNDLSFIQEFLDLRDQHNVPLWMGESGENKNMWYREAVLLLESQNIGWAWWTWKKLKTAGDGAGSFSIPKPDGYQSLIDHWESGGAKPDADFAFSVMMQLAENSLLENNIRNDEAIDALTSPMRSCDDSPAERLDTTQPTRIETDTYCSMQGITSDDSKDVDGGLYAGFLDAGDWLAFNVDVPSSGKYKVEYRVASLEGLGGFQLEMYPNGRVLGSVNNLPTTGDWQNWQTVSDEVELTAGVQTISITVTESGFNLNWFQTTFMG